jgi:hypothetical protein
MPDFRPDLVAGDGRPITASVVRELCAAAIHPANFFVAKPLRLTWKHTPEMNVFWELFHGRALDRSQTRQRRCFEAWNVFVTEQSGQDSDEPLLSVKYDAVAGIIHVTRAILCYAHEVYDGGGNVIQSREVVRWQRELVGTVDLADLSNAGSLRDELACLLFHAVVGLSRLPLTSIEAPLPAFMLGQLGYIHRPAAVKAGNGVLVDTNQLQQVAVLALARDEQVKLCELMARASSAENPSPVANLMEATSRAQGRSAADLFVDVFNSVSLSPYTDFVAKALMALRRWAESATPDPIRARATVLARLIRRIDRHLSAYDLVTFHHRGLDWRAAQRTVATHTAGTSAVRG